MPCFLSECRVEWEAQRLVLSLVLVYGAHFLLDRLIFTPVSERLLSAAQEKAKLRESLWKNAAVGFFFSFGLFLGWGERWFFSSTDGYWMDWPWSPPELMRLYQMLYFCFWLQSIDFLFNLTNSYYQVKRKDNMQMLIHHLATMFLMLASYALDFNRIGLCVLLIHDVNDLLLETAKIGIYLKWTAFADLFFGLFAVSWFIVRWGFFGYNIVWSVYKNSYETLVLRIYKSNGFGGMSPTFWYGVWVSMFSFLCILLTLHIIWGRMIFLMVVKTLKAGNVEKDIRSDSEDELDESPKNDEAPEEDAPQKDEPSKGNGDQHVPETNSIPKIRKRRAPKAE